MPDEEKREKIFSLPSISISEHPWLLLVFGLGGGSLGGGLLSQAIYPVLDPVVEAAIIKHDEGERSHNLDRLLEKLSKLEEQLNDHDGLLADIEMDVKILKQRADSLEE